MHRMMASTACDERHIHSERRREQFLGPMQSRSYFRITYKAHRDQ